MTHHTDTLGRAPIMRPMQPQAEPEPCEDWRGESIIANVPRDNGTFNGMAIKLKLKAKPAPKPRITGTICAVTGCAARLSLNNKAGVCSKHRHCTQCQCGPCIGKRRKPQ
jgi:hypothetical protein